MIKNNFLTFFILLLLGLGIIFLNQSQAVLFLKQKLSDILMPFEILLSKIRNILIFWQSAILNIKNLKESNIALRGENLELYAKLTKLRELEEKNDLLKEQLRLSKDLTNIYSADVIGRDFQNNRSFMISKGAAEGIKNNMVVIGKGKTLIGKIINANYHSAEVRTILDTQSRISVIALYSKTPGLIRGLGSSVSFDLIPKNKNPEIEEPIISSGTDGIWPKGLIIGKIKKIKSADQEVFNAAEVEIAADFREFTNVFIINNAE